jgi:hypothetical protein
MMPLDEEVRVTCTRATVGSPAAVASAVGAKSPSPPSRRRLRWEEDEMGDSDIDSDMRLKTELRPLL